MTRKSKASKNYVTRVAILATGTEVTSGQIINSNSAWLSAQLAALGVQTTLHLAVPDARAAILRGLRICSREANLVIVVGGLGPTSDDLTRELVAEFVGAELKLNVRVWRELGLKLKALGRECTEIYRHQCVFPVRSKVLNNRVGNAEGFLWLGSGKLSKTLNSSNGRLSKSLDSSNDRLSKRLSASDPEGSQLVVAALPGPPAELHAMFFEQLLPALRTRIPPLREKLFTWSCLGKPEAELAELLESGEAEFSEASGAEFRGSSVTGFQHLRLGYRLNTPYVEVKAWAPLLKRQPLKGLAAQGRPLVKYAPVKGQVTATAGARATGRLVASMGPVVHLDSLDSAAELASADPAVQFDSVTPAARQELDYIEKLLKPWIKARNGEDLCANFLRVLTSLPGTIWIQDQVFPYFLSERILVLLRAGAYPDLASRLIICAGPSQGSGFAGSPVPSFSSFPGSPVPSFSSFAGPPVPSLSSFAGSPVPSLSSFAGPPVPSFSQDTLPGDEHSRSHAPSAFSFSLVSSAPADSPRSQELSLPSAPDTVASPETRQSFLISSPFGEKTIQGPFPPSAHLRNHKAAAELSFEFWTGLLEGATPQRGVP